jgi:hypothetical protein
MYNQGIQDGLDRNMRYKIDELRQKKLTNYQKKLLHKIETEANEFDRKGNE